MALSGGMMQLASLDLACIKKVGCSSQRSDSSRCSCRVVRRGCEFARLPDRDTEFILRPASQLACEDFRLSMLGFLGGSGKV